jgi:tRNA A-37 threonylcarbamoyl transferase component Bud32
MDKYKSVLLKILEREKSALDFNSIKKIKHLANGATATVYLVSTDKKNYAIKLELTGEAPVEREYSHMKILEKHKISHVPRVYVYGKYGEISYIFMDYMLGSMIKHFPRRKTLKPLAKFYKAIHKITSQNSGHHDSRIKDNSLLYKLKEINPIIMQLKKNLLFDKKTLERIYLSASQAEKYILRNDIFLKTKRYSFTHSDTNPLNYLFDGKNINTIDWVWAKFSNPERDLAGFIIKGRLNSIEKRIFLEAYGLSDISFKRLNIYTLFQNFSLMIWHINKVIKIKKGILNKKLYTTYAFEKEKAVYYLNNLENFLKADMGKNHG